MNKEDKKTVLDLSIYVTFNNKTVTLNDLFNELLTELEDNKTRIDKAIEYIEEHNMPYISYLGKERQINKLELIDEKYDKLLSILRGEK